MSFRVKRTNGRRGRAPREKRGQTYLLSVGEGSCDCPICRAMGIDLDASNGVDIRPLEDPEQLERLMQLIEEVNDMPKN